MYYIAHRGYKKEGIENSLEAFLNAINDDYFSGFELDIRQSKDEEFMVIHDPFIERVTLGHGLVREKSKKELKKYGIPMLKEVLELKTSKIILIEIKDYDINLQKLVKLLNRYPKLNIYVDSFNPHLIDKLLDYKRNFKVGILNILINSPKSYDNYDFVGLYKNVLTQDLIDYFKYKKMKVFVWGMANNKILPKDVVNYRNLYLIVNKKI